MSARMQGGTKTWSHADPAHTRPSEFELECLLRNLDGKNLVAPLREVHASRAGAQTTALSGEKHAAALALQQEWESWLVQRELLRNEIKRGREFLEQVKEQLATLKSRLEEWPSYERVCGKNPVLEYMDSICAHERIEQFLPGWLRRREAQLQILTRRMEECARQNGLEHLL